VRVFLFYHFSFWLSRWMACFLVDKNYNRMRITLDNNIIAVPLTFVVRIVDGPGKAKKCLFGEIRVLIIRVRA
jgi:hypothetical protein